MRTTFTRWVPSDPLPPEIAARLRPLLAGSTDTEWVLVELGRAWQQYRVDRRTLVEVLPRADRRGYLRRMAGPAAELAQLIDEIPQEALLELRALLDEQYPTQTSLFDDLGRVQAVLILLQAAVGRMEPLAAGRTPDGIEEKFARAVAATLTRVGIECTAYAESTFERVLRVLLSKDPHRLAQKTLAG